MEPEPPPPVAETGLSVETDALGRQFLRDATEQDNFESLESETIPGDVPEGDPDLEPPVPDEVDLHSNSVREASLFDHPTSRGGTRAPAVNADESGPHARPSSPDRERVRAESQAAARAALRRLRGGT
jgi:hypothetical protein